jgi:hypothetical protein
MNLIIDVRPVQEVDNKPQPSVAAAPAAGLSPQEATAQAAMYLGYLALLYQNDPNSPEIARIINLLKTLEPSITDPTMKSFVDQGISDSPSAFLSFYYPQIPNPPGPTPPVPPAVTILQWLQSNYSFSQSSTNTDTYFALQMFMLSFMNSNFAQLGYDGLVNEYFGQGDEGEISCAYLTSTFLCAYLDANGLSSQAGSAIASILAALKSSVDPNNQYTDFDNFVTAFTGTYANWTPIDPNVSPKDIAYAMTTFLFFDVPTGSAGSDPALIPSEALLLHNQAEREDNQGVDTLDKLLKNHKKIT